MPLRNGNDLAVDHGLEETHRRIRAHGLLQPGGAVGQVRDVARPEHEWGAWVGFEGEGLDVREGEAVVFCPGEDLDG